MTLSEAEKSFIEQLKSLYDADEAKVIALYAIQSVCGISKSQFFSRRNEQISQTDETSLFAILDELKTGNPVQYIIGETEFYGLTFKVNPSVLIPRPETEELVEWVLSEVRKSGSPKVRKSENQTPDLSILDIGTGSGCIAITLKKHLTEANVYGTEISPQALQTARENAALNSTEIEFREQDILTMTGSNRQYSVIVSNPPYITLSEKEQMHANVLEYEPYTALFVPDNDPLLFYKHIAGFAKVHLKPQGMLFFEINENLGKEVTDLLYQQGFSEIELKKDLNGKDRMVMAKLNL